MRRGNEFGRCVCLSVRLSVCVFVSVRALTFESLGLEGPFWYAGTSSEYLGHHYIGISRSWGQGEGHSSKTAIHERN